MRRARTCLILLLLATSASALPLTDYIATLTRIRSESREAAAADAQALLGATVESDAGRFTADISLLQAIITNRDQALPRIDATLAALQQPVSPAAAPAVDPKLIERLREEENVRELQRGGEIQPLEADESLVKRVAGWVTKAWKWITAQFEKLADWMNRFWPSSREDKNKSKPFGGMPFVVTALAIAIVGIIAFVAMEVLRRSRKREPDEIEESDPISSRRDEDPLSRGANEWELYAARLAAAGRIREAIRAWYHAVLVTCYGAGLLSFRKGRTNWEYVSMLRAEAEWRPDFADLTRRYEREWYGRSESSHEALDDCSFRARSILDRIRGAE